MHVVLVEPEIPQNTGNIGRLCGLTECQLHLVGKLGFSISNSYLRRAGLDYWEFLDVKQHVSIVELWEQAPQARFHYVSTKAVQLYTEVNYNQEDYLVFGSETKGLPEKLINEQQKFAIKIPMWGRKPRSHNLGNSLSSMVQQIIPSLANKFFANLNLLSINDNHLL